jgi:hypothetical protein
MGTRALIHIHDGDMVAPILATLYRQMDGYPSGLGEDIKDVGCMQIVNGIRMGMEAGKVANGMGCYAAQLIGKLKDDRLGSVYMYEVGAKNVGEEYTYHIHEVGGVVHIFIPECEYSGVLAETDFKAFQDEQ